MCQEDRVRRSRRRLPGRWRVPGCGVRNLRRPRHSPKAVQPGCPCFSDEGAPFAHPPVGQNCLHACARRGPGLDADFRTFEQIATSAVQGLTEAPLEQNAGNQAIRPVTPAVQAPPLWDAFTACQKPAWTGRLAAVACTPRPVDPHQGSGLRPSLCRPWSSTASKDRLRP